MIRKPPADWARRDEGAAVRAVRTATVVAKGTAGLAAVVAEFGVRVLKEDGELDREALGKIVFADPDQLAKLNAKLDLFQTKRLLPTVMTS